MRLQCSILIATVAVVAGCNVQTGISPTETVITDCSDRDFGFVGTWLPVPNSDVPHDVATYHMTIKRDDAYTASLVDASGKIDDEPIVDFRTHQISEEHPHAIVELELKSDDRIAYRRLAIAAVKDDHLYLWMIDGRKIGEHRYNDGIAAVIEHFTFSTTVRCEPKQLLESLSKHSGEIVGIAQVFRREPEIGR